MAYPKPLSQKTIDKMFSTWNPKKVELLYKYYEEFSNLYEAIFLNHAWQILETYRTGITKKEFLDFSDIVRRERRG